jgi:hypothetical protein
MSALFVGVLFILMLPTVDGVFSKVCFNGVFKENAESGAGSNSIS